MFNEKFTRYQREEMERVYSDICNLLDNIECLGRNANSAIESPKELEHVIDSVGLYDFLMESDEFTIRYSFDNEALQYLADNCESLNDAIKLAMEDGHKAKDLDAVTLAAVWSHKVNMETFEAYMSKFDALLEEFQQAMRAEEPEEDDEY